MSDPSKKPTAEFDHFVEGYDEKIGPLIKLTGDGREYYAENRVQLLKNKLQNLGHSSAKIMDYGCGTGIALSYLKRILAPEIIYGVDPSSLSIEDAQKELDIQAQKLSVGGHVIKAFVMDTSIR